MKPMTASSWFRRLLLMAVIAVATRPVPVLACDYGYQALPALFDGSTDVFVGTVTQSVFSRRADGQVVAKPGGAADDFRFKVLMRYKGAAGDEVVLKFALSDCMYTFLEGATYMVHAFVDSEGYLVSGQMSRPILISLAGGIPVARGGDPATLWSSELAIAYADTRAHRQAHAFVHGSLMFTDRESPSARPSDDVSVSAERDGAPTIVVRAPNTPWNMFEMVLPPGEYRLRLRRNGVDVGNPVKLRVADGESRNVNLGPGWQ